MMINKRWLMGPILIFAVLTIGADNCALTMIGEPVPTSPNDPPPPTTTTTGGACDMSSSGTGGSAGTGGSGGGGGACGALGDVGDVVPCCAGLDCWAGACETPPKPPPPPGPPGPPPDDGANYSLCSNPCVCSNTGVHGFAAAAFVFETTVKDDGKDAAGGWQVTGAVLRFWRLRGYAIIPETGTRPVVIGMPVRTAASGVIPPDAAAGMTAGVASAVSDTLMHGPVDLPPGIFCGKFKPGMQILWDKVYPTLGAKTM